MEASLTAIVIPVLRQLGFKGSFPHFRRLASNRINLLTFQFDKNGGGFVIEISNAKNKTFVTSWGKKIEPNKLTAHDLNKRKRIQSNMREESSTDDWFRYDIKHLLGLGDIYKKVSKDVLSKIEFANDYWEHGELN